jgi:hypothetical protein
MVNGKNRMSNVKTTGSDKKTEQVRKYIRHPVEIPLEYVITGESFEKRKYSQNISIGGICFRSEEKLTSGLILLIKIPSIDSKFEGVGRVIWCLDKENCFEIGVEFVDEEDAYRARLIEQICYIKKYQKDILEQEHRELSDEQAAEEWTRIFAKNFPAI